MHWFTEETKLRLISTLQEKLVKLSKFNEILLLSTYLEWEGLEVWITGDSFLSLRTFIYRVISSL